MSSLTFGFITKSQKLKDLYSTKKTIKFLIFVNKNKKSWILLIFVKLKNS